MAVPTIASVTDTINNTQTASWAVGYPSYVAGDLLIFFVVGDANKTHSWSATGPQSETVVTVFNSQSGESIAPTVSLFYWIGGATDAGGTFTVTPSISERFIAEVVKINAGEFDSGNPIDSSATFIPTGDQPVCATPSWTVTNANAKVISIISADLDPINDARSGWDINKKANDNSGGDIGGISAYLVSRTAGTTASETVAESDWAIGAKHDSGTHDGSNNVAILADSSQAWTPDAFIGDYVYNYDDRSGGSITDNDATTITATLSGGTDNDWDNGDDYAVHDKRATIACAAVAVSESSGTIIPQAMHHYRQLRD